MWNRITRTLQQV